MLQWSLKTYQLELKFTWKISRGASQSKKIHIIEVTDGKNVAHGEVAGITTIESRANELLVQFEKFKDLSLSSLTQLNECPLEPHLRFGIESAWTHLLAKQQSQSVADYLKRETISQLSTSFSLPILALHEISDFFEKYSLHRFSVLKLKVGHENQAESCLELHKIFKGPLRIDANEAFQTADEVINFIESIKGLPIEFLEQPLSSEKEGEYKKLKKQSPLPIFADESLQDQDIPKNYLEMFDGINVKLMKAGGYQQAIRQIDQARQMKLKIMLGCMVETSLGISSAFNIAEGVDYFDLDGFLFFKEDPFHLVEEKNGQLSLKS